MDRHRCDEDWEEEGRFWLPDDARKYYGRIDYAPSRGPGVHLLDSPLGQRDPNEIRPPRPRLLFGETIGGTPFTLFDGWVVGSTSYGFGTHSKGNAANAIFNTLVVGEHFDDISEMTAPAAWVSLQGFREFVMGGSVDRPVLFITAGADREESLDVALPEGRLVLRAGSRSRHRREESAAEVVAGAYFDFESEKGLDVVDDAVDTLMDLVVFATRHPSWIHRLKLLRRDAPEPAPDLAVFRQPVVEPNVPQGTSAYYSLIFNPARAADAPAPEGPAALIQEWYALRERLGPVWSLYFATLQRPELPLENQLLNLTAFAEGYHRTEHDEIPLSPEEAGEHVKAMLHVLPGKRERRVFGPALRFANSQTQRQRMRWLAERATDVLDMWELDVDEFCAQLADTRNWLTHWGERGANVQSGEGLVALMLRLDLVLTVNLQLDLGLDEDDVATQVGSGLRLSGLP